jgi:hypothetical protein
MNFSWHVKSVKKFIGQWKDWKLKTTLDCGAKIPKKKLKLGGLMVKN